MAPAQKERLRPLTAEAVAALERLGPARSERVDRAQRAAALLAAAHGCSFAAAARRAGYRKGSPAGRRPLRGNTSIRRGDPLRCSIPLSG